MKFKFKRIISALLVLVVLGVLSVFGAQGADLKKMSEDLQNMIKQMTDEEKTDVYLKIEPAIKYDGSYNAMLTSRVLEKMGLTSVPTRKDDPEGNRQFEALRYSMLMEDYNKNAVALLELLDVPEEDNLTPTSVTMYWHWRLTVSQIYLASEQDCVIKMQTTEFVIDDFEYGEPETNVPSDSLIKCIAEEYEITDLSEIDIYYCIQTEKGIITRFYIYNEDFLVPDSMMFRYLKKFTLCDDLYPEPMFYITEEDRLIKLSAAYNLGYVSNAEMEQLANNSQACVFYAGDVNDDKSLDILDAVKIQKYAAGNNKFSEKQKIIGDINNDYNCDVLDAIEIQKALVAN